MSNAYAPEGEMTEATEQKPREESKKYLELIQSYEKHASKWHERSRKIIDLYMEQSKVKRTSKRRYALLYANTQVLQPSVYARPPKPVVTRRFKDKDKVAKQASEVLERALVYTIEKSEVDHELRAVRDDYLLPARGTAWVRYDAKTEPMMDPATDQQALTSEGTPAEKITYEHVYADYVNWRDFGHNVARTWKEVFCVWRRVFLTRDELVERFGKEAAGKIDLDHKPDDVPEMLLGDEDRKATVYEIWDKRANKTVWVAKTSDKVLGSSEPLLKLEGFFPCPRPAYGVISRDSLMPTPDYVYYQDQAEQIDALSARIDTLTDSLKLVGFYPAGTEGTGAIEKAIKPGSENVLVPVPNWAAFSANGGSAQIEWLPVDQVIKVLEGCQNLKALLIQDVYQITGISDIVRGQSNPNETLGAQELKNQWGNIRIRDRQTELARFARDLISIMAEVIADRFQPETLLAMTGIPLPSVQEVEQQQQQMAMQAQAQGQPAPPMQGEPPVTIEAVMELLRDDRMRCFRIDIETDSTIATDEAQDKQDWAELLGAIGSFLQQAIPVGQAMPELAPTMGEMLLTTVRKYRAGRSLEDGMEAAIEEMAGRIKQQSTAEPPPDPKLEQIKMQAQADQQAVELDTQMKRQEMAHAERMQAMDEQIKQIELKIAMAKLSMPSKEPTQMDSGLAQ